MMEREQVRNLVLEARRIAENDLLLWERRYDLIFNERVSRRLFDALDASNYYDPDTTYEEDVRAFMQWLNSEFPTTDDELEQYCWNLEQAIIAQNVQWTV